MSEYNVSILYLCINRVLKQKAEVTEEKSWKESFLKKHTQTNWLSSFPLEWTWLILSNEEHHVTDIT